MTRFGKPSVPIDFKYTYSCARGYVGTWQIINNKLFLVDLEFKPARKYKIGLDLLFPGIDIVFAQWFTGKFSFVVDIIKDNGISYEEKLHFLFENGELQKKYLKWHQIDKDREYEIKSDEYRKAIQKEFKKGTIAKRKKTVIIFEFLKMLANKDPENDELKPVEPAIKAFKILDKLFDVYILNKPEEYTSAYFEKIIIWVKKYLGEEAVEKITFTKNTEITKSKYYLMSNNFDYNDPNVLLVTRNTFSINSSDPSEWEWVLDLICDLEYCDDDF
jgi:hypothetical protein